MNEHKIMQLLEEAYSLLGEALSLREEKKDAARMVKHYKSHAMWAGAELQRDRLNRCKARGRELRSRLCRLESRCRLAGIKL